jgi:hypothetical protein
MNDRRHYGSSTLGENLDSSRRSYSSWHSKGSLYLV